MLLGMIPAGTLGIFAEGTDGSLTVGASDPEGTVYTIYGHQDWATVAAASAAGNTFAGKVVKLGASFGGSEAAPIELATLFANFAGEFDGNGQTISYVNAPAGSSALLAAKTSGTVSIHDLTLTAVTVTTVDSELAAANIKFPPAGGILIAEAVDGSLSILNVHVNGTLTTTQGGMGRHGALVGLVNPATAINVSVKNCTVDATVSTSFTYSNAANGRLVGAGLMFGHMELANVTAPTSVLVEGCTVRGSVSVPVDIAGGVAGRVMMPNYDNCTVTVKDTKVNATLSTTVGGLRHTGAVGGVIGVLSNDTRVWGTFTSIAKGSVLLENVKVEGTFTCGTTGGSLGGIIGATYGGFGTESVTDPFDVDVTVKRCEVLSTLNGNSTMRRGGQLTGMWGAVGWTNGDGHHTGVLTVEDSFFGGKIVGPIGTEAGKNGFGGLFGTIGYHEATINVMNCAIVTAFENVDAGAIAGVVKTDYILRRRTIINVQGCLTNYTGTPGVDFYLVKNENVSGGTSKTVYNGVEIPEGKYSDASLLQCTDDLLATMIVRNANGDIVSVSGALIGGYEQHTAKYTVTPAEGESYEAYSIRFIALSLIEKPLNAGIQIVVKNDGGEVVKTFDTTECKAYDTLTAYAPTGDPMPSCKASDYGANLFVAHVITNIPTGAAYIYEVTPHYEMANGTTVWGKTTVASFDADGNLLNPID